MTEIESFRDEIRNLEVSQGDPYNWERHREKALRLLRKVSGDVRAAIREGSFTPGEILTIASLQSDWVELTRDGAIVEALKSWIEANRERENTTEIRLYTIEAERMLSSVFI